MFIYKINVKQVRVWGKAVIVTSEKCEMNPSSPPVWSGVRIPQSLVLGIIVSSLFSFGYGMLYPSSIYGFAP